ncbi:MAG: hypothetical protein Q8R96_21080 [Bacteroidota bacterium]|nr:hypothetical protein [Bacteroidota bacterium]
MKKLIAFSLIMIAAFTLQAQQLKGTREYSEPREFGGSRYTIVNWIVNYQIILKADAFYIRLSNPRISVSPVSLYGTPNGGKLYSKTDLGLSTWPDSDPTPYNMGLELTLIYPDGTHHKTGANVKEDSYIESTSKFKSAGPTSFKVASVEYMYYNGGADNKLDILIAAKKNGSSNSSNNPNNPLSTNTQTNTSNNPATQTGTTNTGMPANTSGNDPLAHFNNPQPTYSNNKTVQAVGEFANAVEPLLEQWANQAQAKREEREQEELARLEGQTRREEAAAELRAQKARLIEARTDFVTKLPNGKPPLSYQAKEATEIYFFTYSFQTASIEETTPLIYISNVFTVAKYGDGSWPFKSNLIANIAKTNNGLDLILSDYYLSKTQAEEQQQLLVRAASSYDFSVQHISYSGIKSSGKTEAGSDFWGNATNDGDAKSNSNSTNNPASANAAEGQDFWGNPITTIEKKPESSTEKKQEPKDSKEDADFWGNPTNTTKVMLFGFVYMQKCNSEEVEYHTELLVDESSYVEESKKLETELTKEHPNAKRITVGSSKFDYGSSATNMCLIKWRGGSKACGYYVLSISFGKTQQDALNNAMKKKNTYADSNVAFEIVEQKFW